MNELALAEYPVPGHLLHQRSIAGALQTPEAVEEAKQGELLEEERLEEHVAPDEVSEL